MPPLSQPTSTVFSPLRNVARDSNSATPLHEERTAPARGHAQTTGDHRETGRAHRNDRVTDQTNEGRYHRPRASPSPSHAPRPRSSAQMRRAQARNGSYEQLQPRCCRRRCNALHLSPYTGVRLAWPRLVRTHARGCGECAQGSSHFAKEQPSSVSFLKALPKSSASLPSSSA